MRPLLTALVALVPTALCAAQTTWYVDASAAPPGAGTVELPYASLQDAIASPVTVDGDTISVAPGTYFEHLDFLGKELHVVSEQGPAVTVVDGGGVGSVVRFVNGETSKSVLEGLRITNGLGEPVPYYNSGAGVMIDGASPTLRGCEIVENGVRPYTFSGGGIFIRDGSPRIEQCSIADNEAVEIGAGIEIRGLSSPVIVESVIEVNRLGYNYSKGGGVFFEGSSAQPLLVLNSRIEANVAFYGGGVYGPMEVRDSEFLDNEASTGGGASSVALLLRCTLRGNMAWRNFIYPQFGGSGGAASSSTLVECLVDGNSSNFGGGIAGGSAVDTVFVDNLARNYTGSINPPLGGAAHNASLLRCTLVDNETYEYADDLGYYGTGGALSSCTAERCVLRGNLSNRGGAAVDSTLIHCTAFDNDARTDTGGVAGGTVTSSIVWGNQNGDADAAATFSYSLVGGGAPGTGNLDLDPRFWNASGGDLNLIATSPCIDAGDPASPLDPDGSRADMGAFPFDPTHAPWTEAFCFGSEEACPCGNGGSGAGGCDIAQGTGGVELAVLNFAPDGAGGGSADLVSHGYPPNAAPAVVLVRSTASESPPVVFGDGLRCIATTGFVRVGSTFASRGTALRHVSHGAGSGTYVYQAWLRNQPPAFCTPAAFNLSNGLRITWQ